MPVIYCPTTLGSDPDFFPENLQRQRLGPANGIETALHLGIVEVDLSGEQTPAGAHQNRQALTFGHVDAHISRAGSGADNDDAVRAHLAPEGDGDPLARGQVLQQGLGHLHAVALGDQLFDQARQAQAHGVTLGHGTEVDHVLLHQRAQDVEAGAGIDLQLSGDVHRAFRCAHLAEVTQDAYRVGNGFDECCAG
ncbi:hypothetical protein D9M71_552180 [compost metagenome]